jgi:hypothetical protein
LPVQVAVSSRPLSARQSVHIRFGSRH